MGEKTLSASLLHLSLCTWQVILLAEGMARLTLKFYPYLDITLCCDYVFPFLKKCRSSFFFYSFSIYDCWRLVGTGIILWLLCSADSLVDFIFSHCPYMQDLCREWGDTIFIFPVGKLYIYRLYYFRWKYCLGCFHFSCITQSRQRQFLFYMAQTSQFSRGDVYSGTDIWLRHGTQVYGVLCLFQLRQQWM